MNAKIIGAAALGTMLLGGAALAYQTMAPVDGQSRAEFVAKAGERFDRLDANRDGVLTRDERRAGRGDRPRGEGKRGMRGQGRGGPGGGMLGERLDADSDGRISRAEASAPMMRMFERADANRDGYIDAAERTAAQQRRSERRERRADMAAPADEAE